MNALTVDHYIGGLLADEAPAPAAAAMPAPAAVRPSAPPPRAEAARPAPEPIRKLIAETQPEPAAPTSRPKRWLCFEIAGQSYGIELLKVQEVQRVPEIVPIRGAPRELLGVINLRGQIVHVVDLALKLGFPACDKRAESARVVVLEERGETVGLLVSAVAEVATLDDASIESADANLRAVPHQGLIGIARHARTFTSLLDGSAFLS